MPARFAGWKKNAWIVVPLLLLAADVGSTSFQIPFRPLDLENSSPFLNRYMEEGENYLKRNENVPHFLFMEAGGVGEYTARVPAFMACRLGQPSEQGVQWQTAPRASNFGRTFYTWLSPHFQEPHVFPDSFMLAYFYLNNFKDVIGARYPWRTLDTSLLRDVETDDVSFRASLRYRSPVVAATALESHDWKDEADPEELRQLYAAMEIDYAKGTAARLFVRPETPKGKNLDPVPSSGRPTLSLLDYKVRAKSFFYRMRLDRPAYLRLSASYYSFLTVRLDGKKIPFYPGATYEVLLKAPAGEHVIEVEGGWDPYRLAWLYVAWAAIAALAFLAIRYPAGIGPTKAR
jgi:hypothetical protein